MIDGFNVARGAFVCTLLQYNANTNANANANAQKESCSVPVRRRYFILWLSCLVVWYLIVSYRMVTPSVAGQRDMLSFGEKDRDRLASGRALGLGPVLLRLGCCERALPPFTILRFIIYFG